MSLQLHISTYQVASREDCSAGPRDHGYYWSVCWHQLQRVCPADSCAGQRCEHLHCHWRQPECCGRCFLFAHSCKLIVHIKLVDAFGADCQFPMLYQGSKAMHLTGSMRSMRVPLSIAHQFVLLHVMIEEKVP